MATLIAFVKYEWFEDWKDERVKHRGENYNSLKTMLGKQLWNQVVEMYPHLEDKVSI